ncbi:MAG: hypothetical protein ABH854_04380 [Candidatus Diapherotrites archaeon]|nr:hypothetical protein [Candidatus Micrarchaeota archaeon]MBU1939820.1 hypothetical protein [Candidatus Micrarchaeota archaeon]
MKRAAIMIVLFAAVLLAPFASALSITPGSAEYLKGETVSLRGGCIAGETIAISVTSTRREIISGELPCPDSGAFEFTHQISYLDPAGEWTALAEAESGRASVEFNIAPTKPSRYLLISFLSPGRATLHRSDAVEINVKITDSGTPVEDAQAIAWDIMGNKRMLVYKGDGIYSTGTEIPLDAPSGIWSLAVTAQRGVNGELRGGEGGLNLKVEPAEISIGILRPYTRNFDVGSIIHLTVALTYADGTPVTDAIASVNIKGENMPMAWRGENLYDFNYSAMDIDRGSLALIVTAEDGHGNRGEEKIDVVIGTTPWAMLGVVLVAGAAIFAVLAIAFIITVTLFRKHSRAQSLKQKLSETNAEIRRLQEDYFDNTSIGRESYRTKLKSMNKKLKLIEEEQARSGKKK